MFCFAEVKKVNFVTGSARRNCSLLSNNSNIQLSQEDSCDSDPEETSSKGT